jgi:hypothetical protein
LQTGQRCFGAGGAMITDFSLLMVFPRNERFLTTPLHWQAMRRLRSLPLLHKTIGRELKCPEADITSLIQFDLSLAVC